LVQEEADWLPAAASDTSFRESRKFPRFPFRGRAQAVVYPASGSSAEPQQCEGLATDVSRGGLSLLYRKKLRAGQQILLVLNKTNRRVEVCWCCRVWAGLYAVGCQFIDERAP